MSPCQAREWPWGHRGTGPGRSSWWKSPAVGLLEHSQRSREIRGGRDGGRAGEGTAPIPPRWAHAKRSCGTRRMSDRSAHLWHPPPATASESTGWAQSYWHRLLPPLLMPDEAPGCCLGYWPTSYSWEVPTTPYLGSVSLLDLIFKGLDLIDTVEEEELWTEVCDTIQETGIKTIPKEKKCKKAKWLCSEALQISVKRRQAKSKWEKERYSHLNAEFKRIARRDKAFLIAKK